MARNLDHVDPQALGAYLRILRGERSLNQAARQAGTYATNLTEWEEGRVIPSLPSLDALARAYDVPLESLIAQLVPDYRRPAHAHLDQAVAGHLESTPPDALTADVLGPLAAPPLGPCARDTLIIALVTAPLPPFLAAVADAVQLDPEPACALLARSLGELASRLPGTLFTHPQTYPPAARAVLDQVDATLTSAATLLADDSVPRLITLRVRLSGWAEAARVVLELGGNPVDRREAVRRAVGSPQDQNVVHNL